MSVRSRRAARKAALSVRASRMVESRARARGWSTTRTSMGAEASARGQDDTVEIRDATAADSASIWPFLRRIVRAGETCTLPRDHDEDGARAFWMRACTLVAVDGGPVLGTAKIVPNQPGPGAHVA